MRCITPAEVAELFGQDGFTINSNPALERFGLDVRDDVWSRLRRLEARPAPNADRLMSFAANLNRWLPTKRQRLLWFSHWGAPWADRDSRALIEAARIGLGEHRPLLDAPGNLFEAHDYDNQDQGTMPKAQWRDVALLAALMSLVMMGEWDGWLIAQGCTDLVEFWEGNVLLYSDNAARLREGEALLKTFECPRQMR
jgi:hypothetical protein